MKHPLSLAIAAALMLVACGTREPRPAEGEETVAAGPSRADAERDRDRPINEARAKASGQALDDAFAARQPVVAAELAATPAPPPVVPSPSALRMELAPGHAQPVDQANRETYLAGEPNPVRRAADEPVSTFSIDVDTGSYANVRRMLRQGVLPPAASVRSEEFLNYFDYGHAGPQGTDVPFAITTEVAPSPWHAGRQLMMVGLKGYEVAVQDIPAANLVFLIDTSGSMNSPDKLPLLVESFKAMVAALRPDDRVAIVTYAGSAGLVLPSTPGSERGRILDALDRLSAGGSTHGSAGIELAYLTAADHFVEGGVNRVILATDGDFNVGTVSLDALKTMVADRRASGIALSTIGFGTGNYNDAIAEQLADVGDGAHAYIDSPAEGRRVLVDELSSTLLTIARDVKVQVEFNPAVVAEYRLIGYENRALREEDFANDRVDAGDIGAGHEVTALYEIALVGSEGQRLQQRRYQESRPVPIAGQDELAFVKLRWKAPGESSSQLVEHAVRRGDMRSEPGEALAFAAAVAGFADALRGGENLGDFGLDALADLAEASRGMDADGSRAEFIAMIGQAKALKVDGLARIAE